MKIQFKIYIISSILLISKVYNFCISLSMLQNPLLFSPVTLVPYHTQHVISLKKNEEKLMLLNDTETEPWKRINNASHHKKVHYRTVISYL